MRIIPAIDIIDGKCVRLTKGDYATKKIYNESPLDVALEFEANGIQNLHLVDLDGAKSKQIVNYDVLEQIASKTSLSIDFGGGIKSNNDIRIAFESGARQITGGSIAVSNPQTFEGWINLYGRNKIILGADCLDRKIATQGWLDDSEIDVLDFIKSYEQKGIRHVICTDISKDGMLEGPSFNLYKEILTKTSSKLIASGGIASLEDLKKLKAMGCEGAIVGKAIYEGYISLKELEKLC
ncbi:MAG: 1-(5-phosphoribosyl)-5-[(5-phosphoribosylamino)methylideneamino]imidazole-4-carboxamide isomerase [Crocinitomicaceae bacterium]|nr:1-(5-phosphoribosyl)-5-[(5-phosphoribosylamino)methylideneamino]imidazole-4-carboxamide isomerase [Crocinitomicaceae bacterium]